MIDQIQAALNQSTTVHYHTYPNQEQVDQMVKQWQSASSDKELEYHNPPYQPAEPYTINGDVLRFKVNEEDKVEMRLYDQEGLLTRTIPPKDVQQIMKENAIPSMGNLLDIIV